MRLGPALLSQYWCRVWSSETELELISNETVLELGWKLDTARSAGCHCAALERGICCTTRWGAATSLATSCSCAIAIAELGISTRINCSGGIPDIGINTRLINSGAAAIAELGG